MLKKLMERIKGKSPGQTEIISRPVVTSSDIQDIDSGRMIDVYDSYGQLIQISLNEWRDKVLAPNLESHWNDPDELYNLIISAMNDGLFVDIEGASRRLLEVDSNFERSHTILGITLMKLGKVKDAESVLEKGIEKVGKTGTLLTNLAKVQFEKGLHTEFEKTLWQAVVADPNMDNGVNWWLAIQNEKDGNEAYINGLKKIAALPGSWRPQLWLARHYLEKGRLDVAEPIYGSVLASRQFDSDGLIMMSGDLGNNGHEDKIIKMILPAYDPHQHSPQVGFNFLEAMIRQNRWQEAEVLLSKLYLLNMPPYKQHLDNYAMRVQNLRNSEMPARSIDPDELEIRSISFDRPIWTYGLKNPMWLFRQKPEEAKKVLFYPLGLLDREKNSAMEEQEDDLGRFSRAIPLYLAEAVHYWTSKIAAVNFPVVVGGGPVVFPSEPDGEDLCERLQGQADYVVTGGIAVVDGGTERITLRLWNCATGTNIAEKIVETNLEKDGSQVLELEQWLLQELGEVKSIPFDVFYKRPEPDMMPPYLSSLGQSFMLSLVHNDIVPKGTMWGERNMIEYPLRMALHWPDHEHFRIFFLSNIGKAAGYQSDVLPEFAERALKLLGESKDDSMVARLKPLALKAFGMHDSLSRYMKNASDAVYGDWLQALVKDDV